MTVALDPMRVERLLAIKPDHVGDMFLAIPAFRALRATFRNARIDVLGIPEVHDFTRANNLVDLVERFDSPWLDRVVPMPSDWPRLLRLSGRLRREHYDLAVCLRYDFRDLLLTASVRARVSIGYDYKAAGRMLTHTLPAPPQRVHETGRWLRLVEAVSAAPPGDPFVPAIPEEADAVAAELFRRLSGRHPVIAIHGASRRAEKSWGTDTAATWMKRVASRCGAGFVLIGSEADRQTNAAIADGMQGVPVVDASGATDLAGLAAILHRCDALVGVDSGPVHLAALMGLPTVCLFASGEDPERWRPLGERVRVLVGDDAFGAEGLDHLDAALREVMP